MNKKSQEASKAIEKVDGTELLDPVVDLRATPTDSGVRFTWLPPADVNGSVTFVYSLTTRAGSETGRTIETSVDAASDPGDEVCIRVVVTRNGFTDSGSQTACAAR